jgi:hypothetical protein
MVNKLGLLAIVAAVIAYTPMATAACGSVSAQLDSGVKVAQAQGETATQPMQDQNAPAEEQDTTPSQDHSGSND